MIAVSHARLRDIAAADVAGAARLVGVAETDPAPGIGSPLQSLQRAAIVTLAMLETWRGAPSKRRRVLWRSVSDTWRRWLDDEIGTRPVIVALAKPGTPPVDCREAFLDLIAPRRRSGTLPADLALLSDDELFAGHCRFRPVADPEGGELMEFVCRIHQFQPWIVLYDDEAERLARAALAGDRAPDGGAR